MKSRFFVWLISLGLCLWPPSQVSGNPQEKKEPKRVGSGERLVVSKEKGTVIIRSGVDDREDKYLTEPKIYINLTLELLEISAAATTSLASPRVKTEDGKPAEFVQESREGSVCLRVIPVVLPGKGLDLKVEFKKEPEMKEPRTYGIFLRNAESAVLELFQKPGGKEKIAVKLTPFLEVVEPAREFPRAIPKVALDDSFLVLNGDRLIAEGTLAAESDEDDIFLFFLCEGKGLYLLSFRPVEGARPAGVINGKTLRIKDGEDIFEWRSREPILAEGKWFVWVKKLPLSSEISVGLKQTAIMGKNGLIGIGTGKEGWEKGAAKKKYSLDELGPEKSGQARTPGGNYSYGSDV